MSNPELLRQAAAFNGPAAVHREIRERLARWYADRNGYQPAKGGWIKNRDGRVICQGYQELYRRLKYTGAFERELANQKQH